MSLLSATEAEIRSQPHVWASTLDRLDRSTLTRWWVDTAARRVIVTGCGSTYYLAMSGAALLRGMGVDAVALPSSELALSTGLAGPLDGTALVAVSRSGTTSETIGAVAELTSRGVVSTLTVTCDPASPLAGSSDHVLAAPDAKERSVAQTRSFGSMFLLVQALAAVVGGAELDPLRAAVDSLPMVMSSTESLVEALATDLKLERFYFLGSGVEHGVACEGMLKLKEMSLTESEAYHVLEFRHGPMSMVDASAAVIGITSPARAHAEALVIKEMAALGARTLDVGSLLPDLAWWAQPVLALPPLQLLALRRAQVKRLDPDSPRHLSAVIELDPAWNHEGMRHYGKEPTT